MVLIYMEYILYIYMERTGALYIGGTLRHAEGVKRLILFWLQREGGVDGKGRRSMRRLQAIIVENIGKMVVLMTTLA